MNTVQSIPKAECEFILITGASQGIGYEMARQLAAKKHNLILVARNKAKLEAVALELSVLHGIEALSFAVDLSKPSGAEALYHWCCREQKLKVTHLVNSAGFGVYGDFIETDLELELEMIDLNVAAIVVLCKLFGQTMAARGHGRIMNVASILSFIPFPFYSVYSATKAFVLSFSETLAAELEPKGVIVTCLCPGTVETPFHTPAMRQTRAMQANPPMAAVVVAQAGVGLLLAGSGKKVPGFNNWIISQLPRFTPSKMMMKIKISLASKK
jgi:uncharacterized protein